MHRLKLVLLATIGLGAIAASDASAAPLAAAMPGSAAPKLAVEVAYYRHPPPGYRWYWQGRWWHHRVSRHGHWHYY
jgi:hypothetical protein